MRFIFVVVLSSLWARGPYIFRRDGTGRAGTAGFMAPTDASRIFSRFHWGNIEGMDVIYCKRVKGQNSWCGRGGGAQNCVGAKGKARPRRVFVDLRASGQASEKGSETRPPEGGRYETFHRARPRQTFVTLPASWQAGTACRAPTVRRAAKSVGRSRRSKD